MPIICPPRFSGAVKSLGFWAFSLVDHSQLHFRSGELSSTIRTALSSLGSSSPCSPHQGQLCFRSARHCSCTLSVAGPGYSGTPGLATPSTSSATSKIDLCALGFVATPNGAAQSSPESD
ncbi:isoleucyl-tRNA synthase [Anopheles sinensis]|uniref:Isoleucyl-tRNA synthase n=1 Tax=Anopheles sinensis TaxID=74873 RepID=A0A084VTK7_ANOSI|nr:isoleucyl-tRNA synthase [Anopheles sinensis]